MVRFSICVCVVADRVVVSGVEIGQRLQNKARDFELGYCTSIF